MVKRVVGELILLAASLIAAESAWAQQSSAAERLIHWRVMEGFSDALGTTSNYLQGGAKTAEN
jgi:hypothetical protein